MNSQPDALLPEVPPAVVLGAAGFRELRAGVDAQVAVVLRALAVAASPVFAPVLQGLRALARAAVLTQTAGREVWEFALYVPEAALGDPFVLQLPARLIVGRPSDPLDEPRPEVFDVHPSATLDWLIGWLGPRRVTATADAGWIRHASMRTTCELWHLAVPVRDCRFDGTRPLTIRLAHGQVVELPMPVDGSLSIADIAHRAYIGRLCAR